MKIRIINIAIFVAFFIFCCFAGLNFAQDAPAGLEQGQLQQLQQLQESDPQKFEELKKSYIKGEISVPSVPEREIKQEAKPEETKIKEDNKKVETGKEPEKKGEQKAPEIKEEEPAPERIDIEDFFATRSGVKGKPNLTQYGYEIFENTETSFLAAAETPVPGHYTIGAGDEFTITLWGLTEGIFKVKVDQNGQITLPKVGVITVAGKKYDDLTPFLKKQLSKFYPDVNISVSMGKLKSLKIYVVGSVNRPGAYLISSLSTVLNALLLAGGPAKNGTLRNITVIREGREIGKFDLYKFLSSGDKRQDIQLVSEDTIFVPLIGNTVAVSGNVNRQGIYELKDERTLGDVLRLAGNVKPSAYLGRVQIERVEPYKKNRILDLDLSKDTASKYQTPVLNMDLIRVDEIPEIIQEAAFLTGNVTRPGPYQISPGMRLMDILKGREGLLPETYMEHAEIIRFKKPSLSKTIIPVNLEKALGGDQLHNIRIENQDEIRIYPEEYFEGKSYVNISGGVKNPGQYKLYLNATLGNIISMAGNPADDAYIDRVEIHRVTGYENPEAAKDIIVVNLRRILEKKDGDFPLKPLDQIVFYSKSYFQAEQTVAIRGEVKKEGTYPYLNKMKLSDLIIQAGELTNDAYLGRAEVQRVVDYNNPSYQKKEIIVHLKDILTGTSDLPLEPLDEVYIYSKWNLSEIPQVSIKGHVKNPGKLQLLSGMRISDLIHQAGILDNSYLLNAELTRYYYIKGTEDVRTEILNVNLKNALENKNDADILLQNGDLLAVFPVVERMPFREMLISGEVIFPGNYTIKNGETLSSVLKRAGGFTNSAYIKGAVFTRDSVKLRESAQGDKFNKEQRRRLLSSAAIFSTGNTEEAQFQKTLMEFKMKELELLSAREVEGRVVVRLSDYEKLAGTAEDIILEDGDTLFIPKRPQEVAIIGSVRNPASFSFKEGVSAGKYIEMAGGLAKEADFKESYIIRYDGSSLAFNKNITVEPGDAIIIPPKLEARQRMLPFWKDIITIIGQFTVTIAAVVSIF